MTIETEESERHKEQFAAVMEWYDDLELSASDQSFLAMVERIVGHGERLSAEASSRLQGLYDRLKG